MAEAMLASTALPRTPELVTLPAEILVHIASRLDPRSVARWLRTSRFFYRRLVRPLYQSDMATSRDPERSSYALQWGCQRGNTRTLQRAIEAGADPSGPSALAVALHGDAPLEAVSCLLDSGASPNAPPRRCPDCSSTPTNSCCATGWPVLDLVLDASSQAPRWCPVPVVQCLLEHGAALHLGSVAEGAQVQHALRVWERVMTVPQVRGPRRRRRVSGLSDHEGSSGVSPPLPDDNDTDELRYDHCLHAEPCCVALTRLLLQHGADPDLRHHDDTLVLLALCDHRKPVDLLRCLADAGASLAEDGAAALPPLQLALEDAIRLESLKRYPRGRNWSCYPDVRCPQAAAVAKFLLSQGVPITKRSRRLLDKWDVRWRRYSARRDDSLLANRSD